MKTSRFPLVHAALAGLVLALSASRAASAPALDGAPLVGRWLRTWPDDRCIVTLEIRRDGSMTTTDGANVVEARLQRSGPADAAGLFPVVRSATSDNGQPTCTAGPDAAHYPDGREKTPEADSPGHVPLGAILLFAHGDAISLCENTASGSCDHWFRRQPTGQPPAEGPRSTGFQAAVERGFYAVVPENSRSFELIPLVSDEGDGPTADDGSSLGCDRHAGVEVVGDGFSALKFRIDSCRDAAAVAAWAKSHVEKARAAIAKISRLTADDARKYGISASDESFSDGGELFYCQEVARGPDSVLPTRLAVFVDRRRGRALMIFGIDMSMGERAPAFGSDPLGADPASAIKRIARGIGRSVDVAP